MMVAFLLEDMQNLGKRIVVVGVSASGKSTFSRVLAQKLNLPLILMDSIMWQSGWQYIGDKETVEKLDIASSEVEWIIEGYITKEARTFIFKRADTIIYLDYPKVIATWRYMKRWWKHRIQARPELQGSPEKFNWEFLKLVWSKGEAISLNKFLRAVSNQEKIIRLTSRKDTKQLLENL